MTDQVYYGQPRIRDCCGGMGVVHYFGWGGTRAENPYFFTDGISTRYPCWSVPFIGYVGQAVSANNGGLKAEWRNYPYHIPYHYLGYNTVTGAMINAYPAGQVCSLELRGCHVDTAGNGTSNPDGAVAGYEGGISPNFLLFENDSDGPDFLESLKEFDGPGGRENLNWSAWSGATNDRLYGHTAICDGTDAGHATYGFKLWSVKYDLSDYQVSLDVDRGTVPGDDLIHIFNSHVVDGKHFTVTERYLDDEVTVYEDGSNIATMSPHTVNILPTGALLPTLNLVGGAIGVVKDQRLLVSTQSVHFLTGYYGSLTIVEDGADPNDNQVYLALLEDHPIHGLRTVYYYPTSISWDPDKKKTVVCWTPPSKLFGPSSLLWWSGFLTYIHEPLEPGNILDQMDKISLYMNWPGVGYGYDTLWTGGVGVGAGFIFSNIPSSAPRERGIVIPGVLPQPLTAVIPGESPGDPPTVVLPPTPPEPPEPPNCDGITECDTNQGTFWNTGFENYTAITTDVGLPFGDLATEVFGEELNFVAIMPDYEGGGLYSKSLIETPGDYANAGRLIRRRKPVDAPYTLYTREEWASKVYWQTACVDGYVKVTSFYYDRQVFEGDDGSTFPTYIGTDTGIAPGDLDTEESTGGLVMGLCQSDYFQTRWFYEDVNEDGDTSGSDPGSKNFWVMGILGVQPGEMPP